MPSLEDMHETCGRLLQELRTGTVETHRLLEIETIIRLLVPHLTRALADAVLIGRTETIEGASGDLARVRESLEAIGARPRALPSSDACSHLTEALTAAEHMIVQLQAV